ncbi:MAG TPA: M20/M25/M40 family metallo-hydrolase [Spirochaetota bacterium]|nr:M20/M25/M40 family metallo-hydrolase [Spirochaetota bacterium]
MFDINKKRLIKTFTDMTKISSPSWREEKMRDYIVGAVKKLGVRARSFPCGGSYNLLLTRPGDPKRKPVLFSAHMDTVTPCDNVKPVVTATKITSDGTTVLGSDDKAAIAMFIESLRYISETRMPHGTIEILISCAEEVGLRGMKGFDTSVLKSKQAFVFDSDGPIGTIVLQAPYHSTMTITVRGRAAHAGMEPEKGINAINVLADIITRLPSGRVDHETTVNVGTIAGGRATNIVAEKSECVLEARSLNPKKLKEQEAIIRTIAKEVTAEYGARCSISRTMEYSGFSIGPRDRIAVLAARAMERIGIRPQFEVSGGGSDTNILNRAGISAINLSAGMQKVHTTDEYIMIRDLVNGTKVVLSIVDMM